MGRGHLLLAALALVLSACAGGLGSGILAWPTPRPTPSPAEIVEQLRLELIPAVDSPTGYGPSFDQAGYAGWVSGEYKPRAGTLAGLGWAKRWGVG